MGNSNKKLCYSDEKPTRSWCSFEAVDNYSIWVEEVYLASLLVFAYFIGNGIYKLIKNRKKQ